MPLTTLVVEDSARLDGPQNLRVDHPAWGDVESAIRSMDGEHRSLVMLCPSACEDILMGIGGGERGLCCCFTVDAQGDEFALIDPAIHDETQVTFLMGELNTRPRNERVTVAAVLEAAKWYFDKGDRDPRQTWRAY
jgi:hypothetical protein